MLKSTIVRVFAFTALFAYIIPSLASLAGVGHYFAFSGSILAALGVGAVYVAATFVMLVVICIGSAPFKLSKEKRVALAPLWAVLFLIATTACLFYGGPVLGALGLTVVGLPAAVMASGLALAVMHLTLPDKLDALVAKFKSAF